MGKLIFPKAQKDIPDKTEGLPEKEEKILKVDVIEGKDFGALIFNIFSLLVLFFLLYIPLKIKGFGPFVTHSFPMIAVWAAIVLGWKRIWTEVPEQESRIYVDWFFSESLLVYTQGGNFIRWSSKLQTREVNFQKFIEIRATRSENKAVGFSSLDGFDVLADLEVFFRYREGKEALQQSLRYQSKELESQILALISSELATVGGANKYEDILTDQATLAKFVADLFGGENKTSEFERKTGIDIINPKLKNIGLTPSSQKIFEDRAKANTLAYTVKSLLEMKDADGKGLTATEASRTAQAVIGSAERVIYTYEGIPEDATTVALGSGSGIALTGNNKKDKKKKGDE